MENYLEKNYPGKYIVTTIEKIEDKGGEFADTKIYRYAFVWGGTTKLSVPSTRPSDVDGHFYDREKEILYPSTRKTNNYGSKVYQPFINSIVRHIETSAK
ncbi:MAG: hypothetical protein EOP48_23045 [Sphingobacteriales bacterium]|nr:MAG: hypothetical protein EOP48_23045 [Sphingobacteriales bacterium]